MNTARILSIAAIAAFASMGAQAHDQWDAVRGANQQVEFKSERTRAEVHAEAVQAVAHFKNDVVGNAQPTAATSTLARETVRAEAVTAVRNGTIETGIGG